jgi:tetratricopeptide (TPR) repeat protein
MSDAYQAEELLQQGIAAVKAGHKEQGRQLLMQVVELDEQNEQGWLWLSGVVETLEDRRICLENVLTINPGNAHALAGLEWLEQQAPAPSAAQEQAIQDQASASPAAGDQCPRCGAAVSPSASVCASCGLPLIIPCPACGQYIEVDQTACPDCGQRLGDFRSGVHYHLELAQAYLFLHKLDRAQEAIARAEAESPADPQVLEALGNLYEKIGRPDEAIAAYQQAIERDPDNPALYVQLGAIYRQRSQPDKAQAMYQKAAQLAGNDPDVLIEMARLLLDQDNTSQGAVEILQQVTRAQPMNVQAHMLLGDALLSQQHREQAQQHYQHACKLTSPDSSIGLEARSKLGQLQASVSSQAQARQAGPGTVARAPARKRPGCVTVYAILLALGAVSGILGAIAIALMMSASRAGMEELSATYEVFLPIDLEQFMGLMWVWAVGVVVLGGLNLAIAIGLWAMKNWARIAVLIMSVLGLLLGVAQAATSILTLRETAALYGSQSLPITVVCPFILNFAIQGYIIFWFVSNRELFD